MAAFPGGPRLAYTLDSEFEGQLESGPRRCHCDLLPARRVCFEGTDVGRRFYGCCFNRCSYTDWVDDPWPHLLQRCLTKLWLDAHANDEARERNIQWLNEMVDEATEEDTAALMRLNDRLCRQMCEMETEHADTLQALGAKHAHAIQALQAKHAAAMRASGSKDLQSIAPRASTASCPGTSPKRMTSSEEFMEELCKKQKCSGNPVKNKEPSGKEVGPNAAGKLAHMSSMNNGTQGLSPSHVGTYGTTTIPHCQCIPLCECSPTALLSNVECPPENNPTKKPVPTYHTETMNGREGGILLIRFDDHAPCYCTEPGCTLVGPPYRLLRHLFADHSWPAYGLLYGKVTSLRAPLSEPCRLFLSEDDGRVFALVVHDLGAETALSVVCVRAEDGEPRYTASLRAIAPPPSVARMTADHMTVVSSDRPGEVAVENLPCYLKVPRAYLQAGADGASEELSLKIKILKISSNHK